MFIATCVGVPFHVFLSFYFYFQFFCNFSPFLPFTVPLFPKNMFALLCTFLRTSSQRKRDQCPTTPSDSHPERDGRANSQPQRWTHSHSCKRDDQERVMDIPEEVMEFALDRSFELDHALFTKCLQSAPSGCAPGPGGCTNEMLRVCLDREVFQLLFRAAEDGASASMPEGARKAFMSATMTALQKPTEDVRGIAIGTSFRRLVAKTPCPHELAQTARVMWSVC